MTDPSIAIVSSRIVTVFLEMFLSKFKFLASVCLVEFDFLNHYL